MYIESNNLSFPQVLCLRANKIPKEKNPVTNVLVYEKASYVLFCFMLKIPVCRYTN